MFDLSYFSLLDLLLIGVALLFAVIFGVRAWRAERRVRNLRARRAAGVSQVQQTRAKRPVRRRRGRS